jgi:hypothetical protein
VSANLAGEALSTDFSGATAGSGPRPPIFRPPVPPITRDRASG